MEIDRIDKSLLQLKQGTSSDTSIKTLLRYYRDDSINLRPNYQRNEVINRQKASGIIESAVLGIPLPPIYLFKDKEGNLTIVFGKDEKTGVTLVHDRGAGKLTNIFGGKVSRYRYHCADANGDSGYSTCTDDFSELKEQKRYKLVRSKQK